MNEEPQTSYDENDCSWRLAFELDANESGASEMARECVVGDRIVAVFRHAGDWFAIDGMCAHQGGPLAQGHVADGCVTCPWHGWQYELATGVQTMNQQPLQTRYRVRQIDGRIEVAIPNETTGSS